MERDHAAGEAAVERLAGDTATPPPSVSPYRRAVGPATELEARFSGELLRDERVLWIGRPGARLLVAGDVLVIPFGVLWTGFAISALVAGLAESRRSPPVLVSAAFAVIGLYLVLGRFVHKAWRRRRTFYAVTDRRVIVLIEGRTRTVRSAFIDQLSVVDQRLRADGSGTLTFGVRGARQNVWSDDTGLDAFEPGERPPVFHDIPDAAQVHQLVVGQRGPAGSPARSPRRTPRP